MAARYVRIMTEATDDNSVTAPLFFDVVIDTESNKIVGEHLIFAYQCFPEERARYSYPFVVDRNGRTDFGDDVDGQYGSTNLRDLPIRPGTIIEWRGPGWDETFRIKELLDLVAVAK
jgi:hypothetical protein